MLLSAYHTVTRPSFGTVVIAMLLLGICARALAQDHRTTGPDDIPVYIPHGLRVDSALANDLLRRVHAAVRRSNDYVEIRQVPPAWADPLAGTWRKTWCDLTDVAIDMQSIEVAGQVADQIAGIVTGRTHSDVARGLPKREAAERESGVHRREIASDGRFALLYVHADGQWRLKRAAFQPQLNATPETLRDIPKNIWQDLWNGGPGTEQQDFCLVAHIWRRL